MKGDCHHYPHRPHRHHRPHPHHYHHHHHHHKVLNSQFRGFSSSNGGGLQERTEFLTTQMEQTWRKVSSDTIMLSKIW